MTSRVRFALFALLFAAGIAGAQPRSIGEPDDFVDPRQHEGPVFISSLVAGAALNPVDHYRPLGQDAGLLQLTNSIYWNRWQFDYKHSEARGRNDAPAITRCGCDPSIYFPTPPPADAMPAAPQPGPRNTLQVGFYRQVSGGEAGPPIVLRARLSMSRQHIGTVVRSPVTGATVERRSGHEQSFGFDTDTHFTVHGRAVFGSLAYARTSSSGTIADRAQQELTYTARPEGWAVGRVLTRATLTVGGVSNRGGTAFNVVNPAFEAFFHSRATAVNVHFVWSPLAMRDGIHGWHTQHQVAVFVDRALFVFMPGQRRTK